MFEKDSADFDNSAAETSQSVGSRIVTMSYLPPRNSETDYSAKSSIHSSFPVVPVRVSPS